MYLFLFESEFVFNYFRQALIGCFLIPTKYILMITLLFPLENNAGVFNPFKKEYYLGKCQGRVMFSPGSLHRTCLG